MRAASAAAAAAGARARATCSSPCCSAISTATTATTATTRGRRRVQATVPLLGVYGGGNNIYNGRGSGDVGSRIQIRRFAVSSGRLSSRPSDGEGVEGGAGSAGGAGGADQVGKGNEIEEGKESTEVEAGSADSAPAFAHAPVPTPGKDKEGGDKTAAADSSNGPDGSTTGTAAYKETLRNQGYGSARARANRVRVEEVQPLRLPDWFVKGGHVSLYEERPIGSPDTLLFPLEVEDRGAVLGVLESLFKREALTCYDVEEWRGQSDEGLLKLGEGLVARARGVHMAAFLQVLAVVHRHGADPEHIERLRRHHEEKGEEEIVRMLWWFDELPLSGEAQRWLAHIRSDSRPGSGALHGSPLANRLDPEYPACMELLASVRAELLAELPGTKLRELQRPVTVLSVLNQTGRAVPVSVVNDIATDLKADVVHLDASTLASLLGDHLGQNLHWGRGSMSTLGYAAAEMNGRLPSRGSSDGFQELGMIVSLPPRLRSVLSAKDSSSGVEVFDGRWEDVKLMRALESLVAAADAKRDGGEARMDGALIVHLHDYVEISSLNDGIIAKLRHIVDRMWQKGRRVVLVGSSASDATASSQWRDQLIELGREGNHIIPFHVSKGAEWMERNDNFRENISNIKRMLQAILGSSANVVFDARNGGDALVVEPKYAGLVQRLCDHVYDVQWVYRLASLMLGSRTPRFQKFDLANLQYALNIMSDRDKHWLSLNPSVRPPYFSPLFTSRSAPSFMSSDPENWGPGNMSGQGPASSKEHDQHEKKLLSGLINASDIHTTFDDIIVPPETKESLIGLTSLSLVRPDAFSYGVLKTERIPGCLLYGPPGTGKTLLAKAVAKESGANMLEVSAASINDMWLGQSEKNVRALFSLARKMAPMVIFLDEADALLGARHNAPGRTAHRETITQFLREWDGLSDMRAFIMVATNRPFDLDEAVLRRLPRKILVDLPLTKEREGIFRVMLREETLAEDVDVAALAKETELYSGSDLKNLCVSAAMEAVREEVRMKDAWQAENDEPFVFPDRRVLTRKHFEKGMREISASISEDMESLKAIRKFDAQYGDAGRKRKGKKSMGFEVVEERRGSEEARVRQVVVSG